MKVQALLVDNKVVLPPSVIIKGRDIGVEVDIPDEFVEIIDLEDLKKRDFFELAEFIWKGKTADNRNYKELVAEALSARYREEI